MTVDDSTSAPENISDDAQPTHVEESPEISPEESSPSDDNASEDTSTEEPADVSSDAGTTDTPPVTTGGADLQTSATDRKQEVQAARDKPDVRPKRKLGWRAYVLGGSGGTK